MNTFLFAGKDREGRIRSQRLEAENAQDARGQLLSQGWSELQLITDEVSDIARRTVCGSETVDNALAEMTPDDELRFLHGNVPGFWSQYTDALYQAKASLFIFFALAFWGIYSHRTWPVVIGAIGFVLVMGLFPAISIFYSLPMKYYMRLNEAKVWCRWNEVLLCVERLRQTHRLTKIAVGDVELSRCKAQALVGLGRLEEGLAEFARNANDPNLPNWNYQSFLAGIYDVAKLWDKSLECRRIAASEKPDTSAVWIDLAYGLVRGLNRPEEARNALAKAETLEITALGVQYASFLRGLICWREGKMREARQHMEQSLAGFKSYAHVPQVEGLILLVKGHLAAIAAELGDTEAARRHFDETRDFLEANEEMELLSIGARTSRES